MKKTYITPAFFAVELNMRNVAMLSASMEGAGGSILVSGGGGDGTDIGAKEMKDVNLWDEEW